MGTTIGKRVKAARVARGMTQDELAKAVGVSRVSVTQLESGDSKSLKAENLAAYSKALGVGMEFLLTGEDRVSRGDNFEPGPNVREVPLISWVQAGQWNEIQDNFRPGEAERLVLATKRVGPRSYAVRVVGDSMEPRFPQGCIIIVDPDKVPEHGSPVIVRLENTQEGTFKLLQLDGARRYLKPINPSYGSLMPITEAAVITGVVVQMFMDV